MTGRGAQPLAGYGVLSVVVMVIVGGTLWSFAESRNERRSEARAEARALASMAAAYVDEYVHGLDRMAAALAQNPAVVNMDRQQCERLFAELLRNQSLINDLVLNTPDGAIAASARPVEERARNVSLPYVDQVASSGRAVVSGLTISQVAHSPAIVLAYPVRRPDGGVSGVLDLGIDLLRLHTLFSSVPLPDGSIIALTDRAGLVLARSRDVDRYLGTTIEVPSPAETGPPPIARDLEGVERIVASSAVGDRGWLMSVGIATRVVDARLQPSWRRAAIVNSAALLGLVLSVLWLRAGSRSIG
jgi:Cache domain